MHPSINQNDCRAGDSTALSIQKQSYTAIRSEEKQSRAIPLQWLSRASLALAILVVSLGVSLQTATADVQTQISSREAYVGSPVTLYVQVSGKGNSSTPEPPEVDGLDIRGVGAPSRSSQVTIINGRRSASSSVTYSFQVTPRREGTFEIPSFKINTGSGVEQTRAIRFAATESETGDLMFAEIEGNGEKVFVGQPIDSKLKIWIKPYVDRRAGIKLSSGQMWQLMSEQSEWGGFQATLQEMAENGQTVSGREVLRKDSDGVERAYYLYEIDATIYPKTAGLLDAQDVHVVYQYPLALGKSRDPFDSFFGSSSFGRSSLSSQFFGRNSPFGGRSPFGRSLSVTDARPIVVQPSVTDIEIATIPTDGRPADYRGAVGRYAIMTQASPTHVKAGDPITLQIGIRGTGPMELVQAPPLQALNSLAADFKVADESLAGVVQDDVKVFATTIRPRHEGVAQIPAIPFSYFDPDLEEFVTVKSEPISIEVDKAETLALDSIVGNGKSASAPDNEAPTVSSSLTFQLVNDNAKSVLASSSANSPANFWWLAIIPPGLWMGTFFWKNRMGWSTMTRGQSLREIRNSQTATALAEVVQRAQQHGNAVDASTLQRNIPNEYSTELKTRIQTFFKACDQSAYAGSSDSLTSLKNQAKQIVRDIPQSKTDHWQMPKFDRPMQKLTSAGLAAALIGVAAFTFVEVDNNAGQSQPILAQATMTAVSLDPQQQQQVLEEAGAAYDRGMSLSKSDAAESKVAFAAASQKYQLLADAGIRNSQLYSNLGNAYLQQDKVGNAIASFETAKRIDPANNKAMHNLELAKQKIASDVNADSTSSSIWTTATKKALSIVPPWSAWAVFGVAWLAFWSIAASRIFSLSAFGNWNGTLVGTAAALVLMACGWIIAQDRTYDTLRTPIAVVTDVGTDVRIGAGDEFQPASGFVPSEGTAWRVIQQQGDWCQVESNSGSTGWVKNSAVEVIPSV